MASIQEPCENDAPQGVDRVVLDALSALVPKQQLVATIRKPLEIFVAQMTEACVAPTPVALQRVVGAMRMARISGPIISEVYIPMVARRLGDAWLRDEMHFAGVTIGCARLQSLLRRMDGDWGMAPDSGIDGTRSYLVGVAEGAQHTLGATVLAGHLRQCGYSVHVDLELTPDRLAAHLGIHQFSAVLLSLSDHEHLDSVAKLVEKSKYESRNTPVIVGGALLKQNIDIKAFTKADIVTCDVPEALAFIDASFELSKSGGAANADSDEMSNFSQGFRIVAE